MGEDAAGAQVPPPPAQGLQVSGGGGLMPPGAGGLKPPGGLMPPPRLGPPKKLGEERQPEKSSLSVPSPGGLFPLPNSQQLQSAPVQVTRATRLASRKGSPSWTGSGSPSRARISQEWAVLA